MCRLFRLAALWHITRRLITINENYRGYAPPHWIRRTVERLLASLPDGYQNGLSAIVLTSSAHDGHGGRRSRSNRHNEALGVYRGGAHRESASIELIVDRIVSDIPQPVRWIRLVRDIAVGRVLFHEIGHHLTEVVGPLGRNGELSAEAWRSRLSGRYFRAQYAYLRPAVPALRWIVRKLKRR